MTPGKTVASGTETTARKKISIILLAVDSGKALENSIQSVLTQSHTDLEIIVISQGIPDHEAANIEALIAANSGSRVIVAPGIGLGRAYNAGITDAAGDYIAFLDSNSTFQPDKLLAQVNVMERTKAFVSHTGYFIESEEGIFPRQLRDTSPSSATGRRFSLLATVDQISFSTVMLNRRLFTEMGFRFPESSQGRDDLGLLLRIMRRHQVVGISHPLSIVRAVADAPAYNAAQQRQQFQSLLEMIESDGELSGFMPEVKTARETIETIAHPFPLTIPMNRMLDRLIGKIGQARIDPEPSDNIYMEDVFEPDIYAEILSHLPQDEDYDFIEHPDAVLPDGTKTRKLFDLTVETLGRLSPGSRAFWRQVKDVMISDALRIAILNKFWGKMQERFGKVWPDSVTVPIFYRDYPGYRIGVHSDTPHKLATLQFYLPKDNSQIRLGTSFHRRIDNRFELLKTNTFKPNSAYAFARTDYSWHSVLQMSAHEKPRDSLALTVYAKGFEYRSSKRHM